MKKLLKAIFMLVAFVSAVSCSEKTWEENDLQYTDIYSIKPFKANGGVDKVGGDEAKFDMYEYMVFKEFNEIGVYNTYNVMNRYSRIEDYVDNSVPMETVDSEGNVTASGMLYDFSFTEVIVSNQKVTDPETGEVSWQDVETRRYYTVKGEGQDWTRNYGTVTITKEDGSVLRTYEDASVLVEKRWVDTEHDYMK